MTAAGGAKFYAKNCAFGYSSRPGVGYPVVDINGVTESILWGCTVIRSELDDGVDYDILNGIISNFIEYDCDMFNNGSGATDQASTSHNGCCGARIMGEYHDQPGQCIADVGNGALIWSLGTYAHASATNDNFWIEGAASKMWLDCCTGDASGNWDITAGAAAFAYYRSFLPAGFTSGGGGTIAEY